jgi:hypothetical protein
VLVCHCIHAVAYLAQVDLCQSYPHTMQHIVFKKMVHIQVAGVKDWIVEPETVDGIDFVEIRMKDSGFSRYVTGTTTGIWGMQFLNELRVMRTAASATGCSPTTEIIASIPSKYHQNIQRRRSIAEHGMPNVIDVHLPAVTHCELHMPAHTMKLKASTDQGAPIAVELNEGNMHYLKLAMLAGVTKPPTNKPSEPTESASKVWWRAERNAYVACRSCSSTRKTLYNTFKVAADDDKISTRDLAVQWRVRKWVIDMPRGCTVCIEIIKRDAYI